MTDEIRYKLTPQDVVLGWKLQQGGVKSLRLRRRLSLGEHVVSFIVVFLYLVPLVLFFASYDRPTNAWVAYFVFAPWVFSYGHHVIARRWHARRVGTAQLELLVRLTDSDFLEVEYGHAYWRIAREGIKSARIVGGNLVLAFEDHATFMIPGHAFGTQQRLADWQIKLTAGNP